MTPLPRPERWSGRKGHFALPPRHPSVRRLPAVRPPIKLSNNERTKAIWPPLKTGADFCLAEHLRDLFQTLRKTYVSGDMSQALLKE